MSDWKRRDFFKALALGAVAAGVALHPKFPRDWRDYDHWTWIDPVHGQGWPVERRVNPTNERDAENLAREAFTHAAEQTNRFVDWGSFDMSVDYDPYRQAFLASATARIG